MEVPSGKTVKWVLQYRLTGTQDGTFKLGPAVTIFNERRYSSNTLFITVEKSGAPQPEEVPVPAEPEIKSAEDIGDKILLFTEPSKTKLYRTEGIPVTIRLLTMLPVESLRFRDEPDFPGFLKYDFPFTERPKAEKTTYRGTNYITYQLQQFLIFPLQEGSLKIPSVTCELDVLVPSGPLGLRDSQLQTIRATGSPQLQVLPVPDGAIVGSFVFKNELVQDEPQSKIVRLVLEGEGLLSLFDFLPLAGSNYKADLVSSAATASLRGRKLFSRRSVDFEITPTQNTINIVLQSIRIRQFDPADGRLSTLVLPPLPVEFSPALPAPKAPPPLPQLSDPLSLVLWILLAICTVVATLLLFRPRNKVGPPKLRSLLQRKKPELQISKSSALQLYQQVMNRMIPHAHSADSLLVILEQHLPQEDWKATESIFRNLEWTAFSPTNRALLTYRDLQEACRRIERGWIA